MSITQRPIPFSIVICVLFGSFKSLCGWGSFTIPMIFFSVTTGGQIWERFRFPGPGQLPAIGIGDWVWLLILITPWLLLVPSELWQGWQNLRLMRSGHLTQGRLIVRKQTGVVMNRRRTPVYLLTFDYTINGQHFQICCKSGRPWDPKCDRENVCVMYWPDRPQGGYMLECLPCRLYFNQYGLFESPFEKEYWKALVLPLMALMISIWIYYRINI